MTTDHIGQALQEADDEALESQARLLADMTQGFATSLDIEETLRNAIARFMVYLDAEAASIFLLEGEGDALVCYDCAGPVDITGLRLDADQGIVGKTVRSGKAQMVRDVSNDPNFAASVDEDTGFVTRSILCAPLTVQGASIGALELINKRTGDGLFDARDRHLVTAIAASAALAIHNARMAEQLVEQERVRKELELAREIQVGLLPAPSANPDFPVHGLNIPAREVSGDFFDFLTLPDGRIYFNLADVSGKGMNAALLMAKTTSLLRCLARQETDPGRLLQMVNRELVETSAFGMFVTIVSGFVDRGGRRVSFANAGHQPPLLREAGGRFTEIPAEAPPLGVLEEVSFPVHSLDLAGGALYLFTDGITELETGNGELGVAGLSACIDRHGSAPGASRLPALVRELLSGNRVQHDDITIMCIEPAADSSTLLRVRTDATPECLKAVREKTRLALIGLGIDASFAEELVVAINEACMNVIQHADQGDYSGEIVLEIFNNDGHLEVVLTDFAQPVDTGSIKPRDIEDLRPGGLGTYFIGQIMDEVEYGHLADGCGNRLTMRKNIHRQGGNASGDPDQ